MPNTGSGRLGEQLTAEYLEEKGYEIVERNFKCRFGEIDVIAQNDRFDAADVLTENGSLVKIVFLEHAFY